VIAGEMARKVRRATVKNVRSEEMRDVGVWLAGLRYSN